MAKKVIIFSVFIYFISSVNLFPAKSRNTDISVVPSDIHTYFEEYASSVIDWGKITLDKLMRRDKVIKKHPEKVAKLFLNVISNEDKEKQKSFIEEHVYELALLLDSLDRKKSSRFADVYKFLLDNGFPIDPSEFENFQQVADEIFKEYSDRNSSSIDMRIARENPVARFVGVIGEFKKAEEKKTPEYKEKLEKIAREVSVKYSTNTSVQRGLAGLFLEYGEYKDALNYSNKALELDDSDVKSYIIRSQAKYSLKDIKGAIADVKKATEIDPSDETLKLLSTYMVKKDNFSKVDLSHIKNSFSDASDNETLAVNINYRNDNLNNTDSTIEDNPKYLTADQKKSKFYLKQAIIKTKMKDYKSALDLLDKALKKDPDNLDIYLERANTYNLMNDYDKAIKDATYVLNQDPTNVDALNIRAWALYKKNRLTEAKQDTDRAIELKPDFADAMFVRALIYEKENKYDDMLRELEKASKINPLYTSRFRDAVINYSYKAPLFMRYYEKNKDLFKVNSEDSGKEDFNLKRFIILLLLTVTGGIFIGLGLIHAFSPKITKTAVSRISVSQKDEIVPNVYYEGIATGKYKIIRKLGEGGMGSVYLAVDQMLAREVAIKKMNENLKMNEREKQRFIEEARTVAMLKHPNIIEIYTIFEENDDIYLVFEYVDGETLDKVLDREIRLPFFKVKDIIIEVSKALDYAHSKNVIHRDLKLSNIMMSREGFIKVMDFGLAKVMRDARSRISSTEVVGSPAYMAPEQDLGKYLKESDLFSLGVCMYELLSGEMPFTGPDYHYQKEKKLYTPITQIVAGLPEQIDAIIDKLLSPDPQNRYHSVKEFLEDFSKLS